LSMSCLVRPCLFEAVPVNELYAFVASRLTFKTRRLDVTFETSAGVHSRDRQLPPGQSLTTAGVNVIRGKSLTRHV
jgi:hypothetical protein